MAYSFPLSTAEFMDRLPISQITFDLPEAREISETKGGEILTAELGTRLWQGQITLDVMTSTEADEAIAMLDVARRAGASFMVHDVRRPFPRLDPTGTIADGTVVLYGVRNGREIQVVGGVPNGFRLQRHDYLAFTYGTNPVRYALHRVASPATFTNGLTGWFEVSPSLRPGWTTSATVRLRRPACKAIIVPGSFQPGRVKETITSGVSFRFSQTLR